MNRPAMTAAQIGEVVALAAAGDQYMTAERMTSERVQLWMYAILTEAPEMTFDQAQCSIGHYYARVGRSMQIGDLISTWEQLAGKAQAPVELARDVRMARRFGLVPRDWHESKQLPSEVVARLDAWRADQSAEREQLNREIAAAEDGKRLRLDVGRRV
ncbi:hypothetical protein [Leucobacter luti]|uniref:Uncharacterized protein n=1 Tax=Leucobacter luti TaxID=340320 RepID=A0A4Q7U259_9MICO|nr:hypothetical protein [Leucobacter luti]RZT66770.1 hypothetical protein EV139_0897 [Leucobacter luti]